MHLADTLALLGDRGASEASVGLFEHSPDAVLMTAPDGRVLAANDAACRLLDMSEDEICRLGRAGLTDPSDSRWAAAVEERARTGRFRGELSIRRGGGGTVPVEITSGVFANTDGELRTVVVMRDASHRGDEAVGSHRTLVDPQTALFGRQAFLALATQQRRVARHDRVDLLLLYIDVVDTPGTDSPAGTALAGSARRELATVLHDVCQSKDIVARIGRDDFVILKYDDRRQGASDLVELIRARLEERKVTSDSVRLQLHIGVTQIDPDIEGPIEQLLDEADRAMREHNASEATEPSIMGDICAFAFGGYARPSAADIANMTLVEPLTQRERDVLRLLPLGLSSAEMGKELFVSVNTLNTHRKNLYRKLGVGSRTDAIDAARRVGLLL